LVSNLLGDAISGKIVRKIVELPNDLGLSVIAKDVEDQATASATALEGMGCRVIQGYLLSRPCRATTCLTGCMIKKGTAPQARVTPPIAPT